MRKTRNLYSNLNQSKTTSLYNKIFQKENESNFIKVKNKKNINKNTKDLSKNKNINVCNKNTILVTRNKNENNLLQKNYHSIILNNRKPKKRNIENLNILMNKTLLNDEKRIMINEISEIEPSTLSNTCLKSEIELSSENNKSKESLNL